MRRGCNKPGLNLRTQAARITHLIDSSRLDDIGKEERRPSIFCILPVEVASALLELPTQFDQYSITDTSLGARAIKPGSDLGREPADRLLKGLIKRRIPRHFPILVHCSRVFQSSGM